MSEPSFSEDPAIARRRALKWLGGAGLSALVAACGGGSSGANGVAVITGGTPTPGPTPTPSPSPSPTPTPTPSPTPTPTPSPTMSSSAAPTFAAARPTTSITMLSDSLGSAIVAPLARQSRRPVENWAIGGQTSTQIANRALGVTISVARHRLVAGPNAVLEINNVPISRAPNGNVSHRILSGADELHTITGMLAGIAGTLRRTLPDSVETYDFTPATDPAQPLPVPADSAFVPDFPADTVVYLAGRNNFFEYSGHPDYGLDRVVADAKRVIAAFPRVLVLAVSNSDISAAEYGPDGGLYLQIAAINKALADLAGDRFLDHVRIGKDNGLAIAGLAPDAQSRLDAQHDVISHQLRRDQLHENKIGGRVYAEIIHTKLKQLGW